MENTKRTSPIAEVTADYDSDASVYPERLRVSMRNGHVKQYALVSDQPHPSFLFAMNLLKNWPEGSYQFKEKNRKL